MLPRNIYDNLIGARQSLWEAEPRAFFMPQNAAKGKRFPEVVFFMTNALVSFIKPHFIDILGEDGLTAYEIAQSLDIEVKHVHEKLKRSAWKSATSWNDCIVAYTIEQEIQEVTGHTYKRGVETYALSIRAAKAFIARWENNLGDGYLDFLFDCEQAATEILPKIIAENEALKSSLARATKPLQIKASKKGCLLVPEFMPNIFGQLELIFKWKKKTDISEKEQQLAREKKITESLLGLTTALKDVQDKLAAHELKEKQEAYERLIRQ